MEKLTAEEYGRLHEIKHTLFGISDELQQIATKIDRSSWPKERKDFMRKAAEATGESWAALSLYLNYYEEE